MTLGVLRERPTADQAPRDLSVAADGASAATGGPRVSEAELWAGYQGIVRRAGCVCGGVITVAAGGSVAIAVATHNATPLHGAWRARREAGRE